MIYSPSCWFWAVGSQVYSAQQGALVPDSDPDYLAFLANGGKTVPVADVVGLDEALVRSGLPASGLVPPTKAQLAARANARVAQLRSTPRSYGLGDGVSVMADATTDTIALVGGLGEWGSQNPTSTQDWIDNSYTSTTITGAEASVLKTAGRTYIASVYAALASVTGGINSGSITTYAEVDAFAWPV